MSALVSRKCILAVLEVRLELVPVRLDGKPPVIYGAGEQTRYFTHNYDIVEADLALLESDAADSETMNIDSTGNITITELAEHVIVESGVDREPKHEAAREADGGILTPT